MKKSSAFIAFFALIAALSFSVPLVLLATEDNATKEQSHDNNSALSPPFGDTAGTVFDIIRTSDPSSFICLQYMGRGDRQIWDKRVDGEPVVNSFLFMSRYNDGTNIEIAINPEFKTKATARAEAMRYTNPLGQLPTVLRQGIQRFSIHKGRKGFHAGTGQIVAYADTAENRLSYNHLEETLFHESVHAAWDAEHRLSTGWTAAQKSDGRFLTSYGQKKPEREDLAETALFAYVILHHPDRFPPVDTENTLRTVPHRIEYIKKLLPPESPVFYKTGNTKHCAADAL